MATSRRVGDYTQAGRAVANSSTKALEATMRQKPDFVDIADEAIKGQSLLRRTAEKGKVAAAITKDTADTKLKIAKDELKVAEAKSDLKARGQRMAGLVAGLGTIGSAAIMRKNAIEDKAERDAFRAIENEKWDTQRQMMEDLDNKYTELIESLKPSNSSNSTTDAASETNDTNLVASAPVASTTVSASGTPKVSPPKAVPQPTKATGSRAQAFETIHSLARAHGGFKFPEVVAAQAMHETGWMNPDIKSVYNSSGGTNPFGQTGDRGWGTIPREGFKDGWTLYPDLKTAVDDHYKLWHDTANHPENYNAFNDRTTAIRTVASAYSPNSDKENIRLGYTENGYLRGVNSALSEMGL